ncbi:hypothetical protein JCM19231_1670 [Vibrio ishigakensis]|uniref:Uncharacterized protein n=1 Tax=Vibrio ishigakensis TaxID=1481914 RepID=A0A0B8NYM6_9VIBR|nr:hypothetical protein JCM19231_1670 [Vibrio ishigakensis]
MKRLGLLVVGLFSPLVWAHYPLTVQDASGTSVVIKLSLRAFHQKRCLAMKC